MYFPDKFFHFPSRHKAQSVISFLCSLFLKVKFLNIMRYRDVFNTRYFHLRFDDMKAAGKVVSYHPQHLY